MAAAVLAEARGALDAADAQSAGKDRLAVLSKFLLSKPMANAGEQAARARGESYMLALDDIPAWAIAEVARRWHRGECGGDYNYDYAPNTAVLRQLCLDVLRPIRDAKAHAEALLNAKPIEDAMRMVPRSGNRDLPDSVNALLGRLKNLGKDDPPVARIAERLTKGDAS